MNRWSRAYIAMTYVMTFSVLLSGLVGGLTAGVVFDRVVPPFWAPFGLLIALGIASAGILGAYYVIYRRTRVHL